MDVNSPPFIWPVQPVTGPVGKIKLPTKPANAENLSAEAEKAGFLVLGGSTGRAAPEASAPENVDAEESVSPSCGRHVPLFPGLAGSVLTSPPRRTGQRYLSHSSSYTHLATGATAGVC